ncbi:hypothetical protein G7054_g4973 [Neopestalotiopsis clavispora]|nr:hypothetical protein G7054_g4973 [Neopestalotiopsis clavispora]
MANISVVDNWEKVPKYLYPYLRTVLLVAVKCHVITTTEITDYQLERFANKMFGRGWSSRDEPVMPTYIEDQIGDYQSLMGRRAADGAEERVVMDWNHELCVYLWQKAIRNDHVLQYTIEDFIKPRLIRDHVKESCPWSLASKRTRRLSRDPVKQGSPQIPAASSDAVENPQRPIRDIFSTLFD